jgi:hypothetical protein
MTGYSRLPAGSHGALDRQSAAADNLKQPVHAGVHATLIRENSVRPRKGPDDRYIGQHAYWNSVF